MSNDNLACLPKRLIDSLPHVEAHWQFWWRKYTKKYCKVPNGLHKTFCTNFWSLPMFFQNNVLFCIFELYHEIPPHLI